MPKFSPVKLSPLALAAFPRASIGFVPMAGLQHIRMASDASRLPSIAQPSLWLSMLPKSLRQRRGLKKRNQKSIMERMSANPATFFMAMFILIGSMSINLLGMKNEFATFTRRTDTRICLLREVIERLQAGEKFDVDRALGAGDEDQEREWEDVVGQFVGDLPSAEKSDTEEKHKTEAAPVSTKQSESATETPSRKSKGLSSFF
ncbi:hypothetical protein HOO65_060233 [Ceratocystis lukuohia]|uniref:Altered inheritance of mitochondria protein 11 n=1 Tax=Ceratocystis lukuohia TaxID=2019550 RepID=A0ABR4MDQ6_9PEZI